MAVPDYQSIMLPLLEFAADRKGEISTSQAIYALAISLKLSKEDLKQMLPSGISTTFFNRVSWAATYMKKAGLLEATRRGYYHITQRGIDLFKKKPQKITKELLTRYPEFQEFQNLKGTRSGDRSKDTEGSLDFAGITPSEAIEKAFENLRERLGSDLYL